jgi:gluconokinase
VECISLGHLASEPFSQYHGNRTLAGRMQQRPGHYMPVSLRDSQISSLEPLAPDERGIALAVSRPPNALAAAALAALSRLAVLG